MHKPSHSHLSDSSEEPLWCGRLRERICVGAQNANSELSAYLNTETGHERETDRERDRRREREGERARERESERAREQARASERARARERASARARAR
eukprot:4502381-Pleurochrysis_carterae.AAC.1